MNIAVKIFIISLFFSLSLESFTQDLKIIDSLKMAMIQENDVQKKLDIFIKLNDLVFSFDPDKALDNANQILEMADKIDKPKAKVLAYLQIGSIYYDKSDYRKSLDYSNKANMLASEFKLDREFAASLLLIASNLSSLGDSEKSSELNFQALKFFEELDDKKGIAEAYGQIGTDFFFQENYDKALEYYKQSLELANKINDLPAISAGLNNVAAIYSHKGEYDDVEANIRKSIAINKQIGDKILEGVNYVNLGSMYQAIEIYDSVLPNFNKGNLIFKEFNNLRRITALNTLMSIYYSNIGKIDSSLYYAEIALDLSQKHNLKRSTYRAATRLYNIYSAQNDFENANKYGMIRFFMKDSLNIENNMIRLSQMELFYEFDKLEQEKKAKRKQRELIYIILGSGSVFILILLFIIMLSRNRIKRKNQEIEKAELKSELEIKNKELTTNALSLMRRNEVLSEMADKLLYVEKKAVNKETKATIKKIANDLQKTTDSEMWEEFEIRFRQVHSEFYEKLIKQFPDLSPNEQKLCAFLRLNMSTKEISELTGQRVNTIEMARSRLRKKLEIAHTNINLISFLSQI